MGWPPQIFIPWEDRPECPTCALKLRFQPPGYWDCLFHGAVWLQRVKAWWWKTPIVADRGLGLRLCALRFGKKGKPR